MKKTRVALFVEHLDCDTPYGEAVYNLVLMMTPLGYHFDIFTSANRKVLDVDKNPLPKESQFHTPFKSWGILEITNFLVKKGFEQYDIAHCLLPHKPLKNLLPAFTETLERIWPNTQVLTTHLETKPFPIATDSLERLDNSDGSEAPSVLKLDINAFELFKESEVLGLVLRFFDNYKDWKLQLNSEISSLLPSQQKFVYFALQKHGLGSHLVSSKSQESSNTLLFLPRSEESYRLQQCLLKAMSRNQKVLLSATEKLKLPEIITAAPGLVFYQRGLHKAFEALCLMAEGYTSEKFSGLTPYPPQQQSQLFLQNYRDSITNQWNRLYSEV